MPPRGGVYELLTYLAADNVNRLPFVSGLNPQFLPGLRRMAHSN
jgi:trehalose-6-phosphatase